MRRSFGGAAASKTCVAFPSSQMHMSAKLLTRDRGCRHARGEERRCLRDSPTEDRVSLTIVPRGRGCSSWLQVVKTYLVAVDVAGVAGVIVTGS